MRSCVAIVSTLCRFSRYSPTGAKEKCCHLLKSQRIMSSEQAKHDKHGIGLIPKKNIMCLDHNPLPFISRASQTNAWTILHVPWETSTFNPPCDCISLRTKDSTAVSDRLTQSDPAATCPVDPRRRMAGPGQRGRGSGGFGAKCWECWVQERDHPQEAYSKAAAAAGCQFVAGSERFGGDFLCFRFLKASHTTQGLGKCASPRVMGLGCRIPGYTGLSTQPGENLHSSDQNPHGPPVHQRIGLKGWRQAKEKDHGEYQNHP